MRSVKHLRVTLAAAFVVATAAACGSASDAAGPASSSSASGPSSAPATSPPPAGTAPATTAPAGPVVVTIMDFAFAVPVSVPAGATVQAKNDDGEAHTVTADAGGAFDTMVTGDGTAPFTAPAKPGRYPFHCTYHSNMHGVLVVA